MKNNHGNKTVACDELECYACKKALTHRVPGNFSTREDVGEFRSDCSHCGATNSVQKEAGKIRVEKLDLPVGFGQPQVVAKRIIRVPEGALVAHAAGSGGYRRV